MGGGWWEAERWLKDINPLLDARCSLEKQFAASEQPRLQKTGPTATPPFPQPYRLISFNFNEFEFYYIRHILHYSHMSICMCARACICSCVTTHRGFYLLQLYVLAPLACSCPSCSWTAEVSSTLSCHPWRFRAMQHRRLIYSFSTDQAQSFKP